MSRTVAILGAGKIGETLLAGLLSSGWRTPQEVVVTGRREERIRELEERHGVRGTLSNAEAVRGASLVVIAVKPQDFDGLLGEIGGLLTAEQTVLSVAAAIPTAQIEARLEPGVPVVRAMPNAPALVHEGMAGLCAGAHADEEQLALANWRQVSSERARCRARDRRGRGRGRRDHRATTGACGSQRRQRRPHRRPNAEAGIRAGRKGSTGLEQGRALVG